VSTSTRAVGSAVLTGIAATAGIALAAPAVYVAALSVAATRPGRPDAVPGGAATPGAADSQPRLAVLVPAHDEAGTIERCLATLLAQDYPADRFRVVVVADNCTDDTADIAEHAGAWALRRVDPDAPGKGRALRWAMDVLLERSDAGGVALGPTPGAPFVVDAFVVVDADSVADPGLLAGLAAAHQAGADVVQGDYVALARGSEPRALLRDAAFLLFNRVRSAGKARLGLPCVLAGNGMLFSARAVREHPWSAFSEVEDLEHTLHLRRNGIGPVFAGSARLAAPVEAAGRAAEVQRSRWEGGRARVVRTHLPALVRDVVVGGRPDLWDAAADLAVPPLGLLAAGTVAGSAVAGGLVAAGAAPRGVLVPWAVAAAALPVHVLVGLRAGEADPATYRALRDAPRLVVADSARRVRARGRTRGAWERTPRS
jgi:cellulose synthase/poly-beta-1,6-N-acetylglucosamine synthase-like glycosyltransferase